MSEIKVVPCANEMCFFPADEHSKYCKHHRHINEPYDAKIAAKKAERKVTTPQWKQDTVCGKMCVTRMGEALEKAKWPAERLFTRDDMKQFMASAVVQTVQNCVTLIADCDNIVSAQMKLERLLEIE